MTAGRRTRRPHLEILVTLGRHLQSAAAPMMLTKVFDPAQARREPRWALRAAYFGWRRVIGQVLFNVEENRRVVSAPANDCIAFP